MSGLVDFIRARQGHGLPALVLLALALAACVPPPTATPAATAIPAPTLAPSATSAPTQAPSPTAAPSPTPRPDLEAGKIVPCFLLSVPEVARLTGAEVYYPPMGIAEPEQFGDLILGFCDYGPAARVELTLPGDSPELQARVEATLGDIRQEVAGPWREGYWDAGQGTLDVLTDEAWLRFIIYAPGGGAGSLETAQALAELALTRLDGALYGQAAQTEISDFGQCDVMTPAEADEILGPLDGEPMEDAAGGPEGRYVWCVYAGAQNTAWVGFRVFGSPQGARWYFDNETRAAGEPVQAGDLAVWDANGSVLRVLRGTAYFYVWLSEPSGAREQAIEIAQIVAGRVPGGPPVTVAPLPTLTPLQAVILSGDRWFSFCDLLTLPEVEMHTGIAPYYPPVEDVMIYPVQQIDSHVTGCSYWPSAALGVYFPGPQEDLRASFEFDPGVPRESPTDLGEAAYWEPGRGILDVLAAENYWLRLQVYDGPDFGPGALAAARPLAELALGRLPGLLNGPPPTPYPALAACDVLTVAEAEAILGGLTEAPRVEAAVGEAVGVVDSCVYTGARGMAWVSYRRVRPPENAGYIFAQSPPPDAEPISGLGEEAQWSAAQGTLTARRGGLLLTVNLAAGAGGAREQAVEVARAALARIP